VLSGRGLSDELITRPEESYRLCCVVVCDLETSRMGAPYIYDIGRLRVNRTTLQVFVTYLTSVLYVHPLWFYNCVWQAVKTPTSISNNHIYIYMYMYIYISSQYEDVGRAKKKKIGTAVNAACQGNLSECHRFVTPALNPPPNADDKWQGLARKFSIFTKYECLSGCSRNADIAA